MKNKLDKLNEKLTISSNYGGTAVLKKEAFGNVQDSDIFRPIVSFFKTSLETLKVWEKRSSERNNLIALSDYLLEDIGITRYEAEREASKWFWQA